MLRYLPLAAALVPLLLASAARPASYTRVDGIVVDPILSTSGWELPYAGPNLRQGVSARGAGLEWASLYYADLRDADLRGATLVSSDLTFASLRFAKLANANFNYAHMEGADLEGAEVSPASLWEVNLSEALLTDAVLAEVFMHFANLGGADLRGTDFKGADLTSSLFLEAYVEGADFRGAILSGAFHLATTTGSAFYDAETDFGDTGFDPAVAGWRLVPEPGADLFAFCGLATLAALATARRRSMGRLRRKRALANRPA